MTNTFVRTCKQQNKVASFSNTWYDRKKEYDENNKKFNDYITVLVVGIIVVAIVAFALFVLGVTGKVRKGSVGIGIIGFVLIIVGGALAATHDTKDEPTPTRSEYLGCV